MKKSLRYFLNALFTAFLIAVVSQLIEMYCVQIVREGRQKRHKKVKCDKVKIFIKLHTDKRFEMFEKTLT